MKREHYEPTPEEIEAECAAIRARNDAAKRRTTWVDNVQREPRTVSERVFEDTEAD